MNPLRIITLSMTFLIVETPLLLAGESAFTTEVRPVLAHHCLKCHGPDDKARKGNLRLDTIDAERVEAKSGKFAIVPGAPDKGELIRRIFSNDPDTVMPPPSTKNPLTSAQKDALKRWIAAGAVYKEHWAFVAPAQAPLPKVKQTDWPRNPIDHFVLARMESEGLAPSPEADCETLCRRVSLDLIGVPPTPEELDALVNDKSPDAYEKLVDRLLQNPHYGERWARRWLDLARYADTNGYEKDRVRSVWPWRDWVIKSLNADMPFDQFTIKQLAGDMLPDSTADDRVATGFHRNTMLNEEGGIDPLEFRWKAVIDRNNVTAITWLGLTLGCAQCHTHKFDPIPHREYYQMMAFFNNADEPTMSVPQPDLVARRNELEHQITAREADLSNHFPVQNQALIWKTAAAQVTAASSASAERLDDGSIRMSGSHPEQDNYTVTFDSDAAHAAALRLELIQDPALPNRGPGRAPNGNFVLSHISITAAPREGSIPPVALHISSATADFSQDAFPVTASLGNDPKVGWAGETRDSHNGNRTAVFQFDQPLAGFANGTRWTVKLDQNFGGFHTLGRFRISLGQPPASADPKPIEVRRREELDRHFNAWIVAEAPKAIRWTVLLPTEMKTNMALLNLLPDGSVLASGDTTKRDVYDLKFQNALPGVTAIRLEVIPDSSLPEGGPGRTSYEGTFGDFFLSAMTLSAQVQPVAIRSASQTFANGANNAAAVIDGNPLTGWSVSGAIGKASSAVFNLAAPLGAVELSMAMVFEKYYASALGRFRISVTTDSRPIAARDVPAEIEDLLLIPAGQQTPAQREALLHYYLSIAPELAGERNAIAELRKQMPALPTTLVMKQRSASSERPTFIHHRGEFLQSEERVEPNVLSILPPLPKDALHDRLSYARWLVDGKNPLTGRVTVNRQWAAFFGRGIVATTHDFGYQGDAPTHPQLLDWLAVQFARPDGLNWSLKQLDRLIVTSSTYRQSSRITPRLLEKDPQNRLLARAPRVRLEAEEVRDYALKVSGLLSDKIGGPSVFPPQPASVTSEGTFGALSWNVSGGEDRFRRGLYTFMKRTAPYAMFNTFDAPSGEECVARRDVSDTPLQALVLLNDVVFEDVVRALGQSAAADTATDVSARAEHLFRRILCRTPDAEEMASIVNFYTAQKNRFDSHALNASTVAGPGAGDANDRAAWTATARALLNLDETITKE